VWPGKLVEELMNSGSKTILVTGAGGGLGGAMALALTQAGQQVEAADVSL